MKSRTRRAHGEGFRQGMMTALLVSSPFIVAGIKWMLENADPVAKRMRGIKESDLYTQFFDRETHKEKQATRKLDKFRVGEGNFSDFDLEAASEDDEQLFSVIKSIVKNEMSKDGKKEE